MDLQGKPGELRFTVEIKRKATGLVETHELIGTIINEPENENGSDPQHGSEERSD